MPLSCRTVEKIVAVVKKVVLCMEDDSIFCNFVCSVRAPSGGTTIYHTQSQHRDSSYDQIVIASLAHSSVHVLATNCWEYDDTSNGGHLFKLEQIKRTSTPSIRHCSTCAFVPIEKHQGWPLVKSMSDIQLLVGYCQVNARLVAPLENNKFSNFILSTIITHN